MPRHSQPLLSGFPLFSTQDLTEAQRRTAAFWPGHASEVLGPEDYAVEVYRAVVADTSLTYVDCTTRIRMTPHEADKGYVLFLPLDGNVEFRVAGCEYRGSPLRPLLKAPECGERFEASPVRCLVVDLDAGAVRRAAQAASLPVPSHTVLTEVAAAEIRRLAVRLATSANRSKVLPALQQLPLKDRLLTVPATLRRQERELIRAVVAAATAPAGEANSLQASCELEPMRQWVQSHLAGQILVSELAGAVGLSTKALTRLFARIGCTPQEFVRSLRLERANHLLREPASDATVTEVAYAVGYRHLSLFSSHYRRRYGELPSETLARSRVVAQEK